MAEALHIDFETRSILDLKEVGLDNYAKHPTTDVWCMGWVFGEGEGYPEIWTPTDGLMWDKQGWVVHDHVRNGGKVVAHMAAFELAIWNYVMAARYGWPELKVEQCICTMAMAYAMGLPGALDNAAAAMGITARKDMKGHRLMLQMCRPRMIKPNGDIVWWDDPDKLKRLYSYCTDDVNPERELYKRLMQLSEQERRVWLVDYEINQRGIQVDLPAVKSAIEVVQYEQDRLNKKIRNVTKNFVGFTTEVSRITQWVRNCGVNIPGIAKADVLDALKLEDLPDDVRQVLLIRQEAGRSSTAKLRKIVEGASEDGRVRGTMQYHGAGTGRWAGRRIQPHNFVRSNIEHARVEKILNLLGRGNFTAQEKAKIIFILHGAPIDVIANCMRGVLIAAPGHDLLVADFASIEGRVIAWLAGETWKLDAFRAFDAGTGPDIYELTYAKSFHVSLEGLTDKQRQVGKVEELALGFGGGVGAFQTMARGYNVEVSDEQAETIKTNWRELHPTIVSLWYSLERTAMEAVLHAGAVYSSIGVRGQQIRYRKAGSFLWCQLPSGRVLCYPYPKIKTVDTPWGEPKEALTYMTVVDQSKRTAGKIIPDSYAKGNWQRVSTYGGKLSENVTQAVARDLLAEAMLRLEVTGHHIMFHVHDEVVCEVLEGFVTCGFITLKNMTEIMSQNPKWSIGLPIAVKGWRGKRYRK